MTRDQAMQIVRGITESDFTERQIADFVDCLNQLGLLKLAPHDDAISYLYNRVCDIDLKHPNWPKGIIDTLNEGGFKVVRK